MGISKSTNLVLLIIITESDQNQKPPHSHSPCLRPWQQASQSKGERERGCAVCTIHSHENRSPCNSQPNDQSKRRGPQINRSIADPDSQIHHPPAKYAASRRGEEELGLQPTTSVPFLDPFPPCYSSERFPFF